MKERPILFSATMVRALLDGSKTQTRRVVNPQPVPNHRGNFKFETFTDDEGIESYWQNYPLWGPVRCPYGKVGNQLWVRETWRQVYYDHANKPHVDFRPICKWSPYIYQATGLSEFAKSEGYEDFNGPWKPSIHMPRAASRIQLEITDIRIERLQDCSEEDAFAEGYPYQAATTTSIIGWYKELWESINGAGSWSANPWVWVIEFKRIKP